MVVMTHGRFEDRPTAIKTEKSITSPRFEWRESEERKERKSKSKTAKEKRKKKEEEAISQNEINLEVSNEN